MHGKLGGLVFRRCGDHLVVARLPKIRHRTPTPAEAAIRDRFKRAAAYGRSVLADPTLRSLYLPCAKEKKMAPIALCVADYLKSPEVQAIDLSRYTGQAGETIRVTARDDFEVVGVEVAITEETGQLLERGPARYDLITRTWVYTTTSSGDPKPLDHRAEAGRRRVEVTATDRPGNKTSRVEAWKNRPLV